MNPTASLPHRLREESFRRYEEVIAVAVRAYPEKLALNQWLVKSGLAPITFSARLRDAMLSFSNFSWSSELIDYEKFMRCYDDLKVAHKGDQIFCGSARTIREPHAVIMSTTSREASLHIPTLESLDQAKIVCWLASNGRIVGELDAFGISVDAAKWLEANYDVSITLNPDGSHRIV